MFAMRGALSGVAVATAAVLSSIGVSGASTLGSGFADPAYSAKQVLLSNPAALDGIYWIDPDGAGGDDPFEIYADMSTAGGGWTLGLNSLLNNPSATTDMVSNTGTVGLSSAHTRDMTGLAIDQNAQIRHVLKDTSGNIVFDGYYTGNYHGTMGVLSDWTMIAGDLSALSYHFGRQWSTVDNDVDAYSGNCATFYGGVPWYYSACWKALPTGWPEGSAPGPTGPRGPNSSVPLGSYSIYVRETSTPMPSVPVPPALPLLGSALGLFGFLNWRSKRAKPVAA